MARPSKVSLLSTTTTQSSGSNGSNSTVTQESYNKAKDDSSKKKRSTRRKKETLRPKTPLMDAVQEINEAEQHAEKLSVFAFLVDEEAVEDHEDATDEVPLLTDKPINEGEPHVSEASPDTTSPSDSGISMDDRSFVLDKTSSRPRLPDTDIESAPDYHIFLEQPTTRSTLTWPEIPRAQSTAQPQTYAQAHVQELPHLAGSYPEQIAASPVPRCTPSSPSCHISTPDTYDAIAAKLDSAGRNGCEMPFRSFQRSNYRLLFRLQDEIADLEKELDHFDELCCSDYAPDQSEGSGWDSSRRPGWHHKQYRMGMESAGAEMTAKLDGKLEQYYKIMKRIQFQQTSRKPAKRNVDDFRKWLETELHINKAHNVSFLRHLDASNDSISLQPGSLLPPPKVTFDLFWVSLAALAAVLLMVPMTGRAIAAA